MIALIKPILFKFLDSKAVKELVVKLLEAYSKTTDNTIDDKLTALVKKTYYQKNNGESKGYTQESNRREF